MKLLLVGDEFRNRRLLKLGLAAQDIDITTATTLTALERAVQQGVFDTALLDWDMCARRRVELLKALRHAAPALPIVVLTGAEAEVPQALQSGAQECLMSRPLSIAKLQTALRRAATCAKVNGAQRPSEATAPAAGGLEFSSASPLMQSVYHTAARIAPTPAVVLILGENGTGKTLLARAIHERSRRAGKPFVTVNCPCLPARLVESELFGHAKGAFTGAIGDAMGKVAAAEGGTLFLDEVGELPLEIQPKLLRLLQDYEYERVGDPQTRRANIRVIAATNRDLKAEVDAGRFREDLYYRLNVVPVQVVPLRHRPEDILPSAESMLDEIGRGMDRQFKGFTLPARELLQTHTWPGNLRELRNTVERAAILSPGSLIDVVDLGDLSVPRDQMKPRIGDFITIEALAEEHIRLVVEGAANYQEAAKILGINTSTLYRWRKRSEDAVAAFEPEMPADAACTA